MVDWRNEEKIKHADQAAFQTVALTFQFRDAKKCRPPEGSILVLGTDGIEYRIVYFDHDDWKWFVYRDHDHKLEVKFWAPLPNWNAAKTWVMEDAPGDEGEKVGEEK